LKKLFVDGRTYGRTDIFPLYTIRSTFGSRPNNNVTNCNLISLVFSFFLITSHSRSGEVFILLYVFFVQSTISQQPAGRFTPNFACGRSLGRDVTSPLLGSATPGGQKEGK